MDANQTVRGIILKNTINLPSSNIGGQCPPYNLDTGLRRYDAFYGLIRYSADLACASKPSPRANTEAIFDNLEAPSGEQLIMLERF